LRARAVALLEQNTEHKENHVIIPITNIIYHAGKYYRYKLHDTWYYNQFCRRVEFSWNKDKRQKNWRLEMGTGSTEGVEKLQRFNVDVKSRFNQISRDLR
jgi:hypothetical protein